MAETKNSDSNNAREEVFSKSVRAGKRTYFFDVKSTKSNDYYLTITESKRRMGDDGSPIYEKHKIFLYREDFEKFLDGFTESVQRVNELKTDSPVETPAHTEHREAPTPVAAKQQSEQKPSSFTDVNFEDLP